MSGRLALWPLDSCRLRSAESGGSAMLRTFLFASLIAVFGSHAMGADEYEQPPIEYSASTPDNDVS